MSRILVAEDEPRLSRFLEKGLGANGFTATTVRDGATAIRIARDDFDLMVLDLNEGGPFADRSDWLLSGRPPVFPLHAKGA